MKRLNVVNPLKREIVGADDYSIFAPEKIYFAASVATLPGKPDIVFRRKRIAVFVDSDFWHGHPKRFQMPATNRRYWRAKIDRNKARDKAVNSELRRQGWRVIRFWEYDIKHRFNKVLSKLLSEIENTETAD